MHTVKVIAMGIALLGICLLVGRLIGGPGQAASIATAAKVFLPLWLVGAGINLWIGVSKAGYSLADEAPVFAMVFAVPAAIALLVCWLVSRG